MAQGKKGFPTDPAQTPHSDHFRLDRTSRWGVMLGMLAVGVFHAFLPTALVIGPAWLLLAIEAVFLLPIVFTLLTAHGLSYKTLHVLLLALRGSVFHSERQQIFKWQHFETESILLCVRWYIGMPVSRNTVLHRGGH